jgi:hypothetical protein
MSSASHAGDRRPGPRCQSWAGRPGPGGSRGRQPAALRGTTNDPVQVLPGKAQSTIPQQVGGDVSAPDCLVEGGGRRQVQIPGCLRGGHPKFIGWSSLLYTRHHSRMRPSHEGRGEDRVTGSRGRVTRKGVDNDEALHRVPFVHLPLGWWGPALPGPGEDLDRSRFLITDRQDLLVEPRALCLECPAAYLMNERLLFNVARAFPFFLHTRAGRGLYRTRVQNALADNAAGNPEQLARLIAAVPTLLTVFPDMVDVLACDSSEGGELIRAAHERLSAQPRTDLRVDRSELHARVDMNEAAQRKRRRGAFVFRDVHQPQPGLRLAEPSWQKREQMLMEEIERLQGGPIEIGGRVFNREKVALHRAAKRTFRMAAVLSTCGDHAGLEGPREVVERVGPWEDMGFDDPRALADEMICQWELGAPFHLAALIEHVSEVSVAAAVRLDESHEADAE